MCKKCGNKNCGGCSTSDAETLSQLLNKINEMESQLDQVAADTKFLSCGHPILMIQNSNDVNSFDLESGLGSVCWQGWALCNGASHIDSKGKNFNTPNLVDKFVVGAGSTYALNSTGGAATVTLQTTEIPSHSHTITDPGHTHAITDPGHTHAAGSDPHTHTGSSTPHNHTVSNHDGHFHSKTFKVETNADIDNTGGTSSYLVNDTGTADDTETMNVGTSGAHTHTLGDATASVSIANATVSVSVSEAFTGVSVGSALTGITVGNSGGGQAHNNLPPYYAVIFVIKIG